jgi:hypothetical protein
MGGLWFFVSFRIFYSDNMRVRTFIFLSRKAQIFFLEFNIRYYDKNSESEYFFFPPPKSEYFFQRHWESEYFFRKKPISLLQIKWSVPLGYLIFLLPRTFKLFFSNILALSIQVIPKTCCVH